MSKWLLLYCMMALAACAPVDQTAVAPQTLWGQAQIIDDVTSTHTAALTANNQRVLLAYSSVEEDDSRHLAATDTLSPRILALKAFYPFDHMLLPAANDLTHLLWIDRSAENDTLHLQSATVKPDLVAELGPINLSRDQQARRYDAVSTLNSGAVIVWTAENALSPALYMARIDGQGRATFPARLISEADYPRTVSRDDGTVVLYFVSRGALWRGVLREDTLTQRVRLGNIPPTSRGDYLREMYIGADRTHDYLLWQVDRADGQREVWWTAGRHDALTWADPVRLGVTVADETVQTTFNSGNVQAAGSGDMWLSDARPVRVRGGVMPAATYDGDAVGVVYFSGGEIIGYQSIVPAAHVLHAPALAIDNNRHLYLTWTTVNLPRSTIYLTATRSLP